MQTINYIIRKGKHYHSNWRARLRKLFAFGVDDCTLVIPKEAWYKNHNKDAGDMNKLHGISGLRIHQNSARLVYVPNFKNQGLFDLYAYVYSKGKRLKRVFLKTVEMDRPFDSKIKKHKRGYSFTSDMPYWNEFIRIPKPKGWFRAFPFHGGNNPARRAMTFTISYKKNNKMKNKNGWLSIKKWSGFTWVGVVVFVLGVIAAAWTLLHHIVNGTL